MKKILLFFILFIVLSGTAFAIDNKIGVGVSYNLWYEIPMTEASVRGIFSNVALELSGSTQSYEDNDTGSSIGLSVSYIFETSKNLLMEAGLIITNVSSISKGDYEDYSIDNGLGIVVGVEYLASNNFGIGFRLIPLLSVVSKDMGDDDERATFIGSGTVTAHYYFQ